MVRWGLWLQEASWAEGWPARPTTLSAVARSVGGGEGPPAWPRAEAFSPSSGSEQAVRGRGADWHRGQATGPP